MAMDITIKYKDNGKWLDFNIGDINHMSRNHAMNLFAGKIPVIVKEGTTIISNDKDTRHLYHKKRMKVMKFTDCILSMRPLCEVGFLA
jgi:alpha-glucosidase (family GH31 glycosyl hydrolase)